MAVSRLIRCGILALSAAAVSFAAVPGTARALPGQTEPELRAWGASTTFHPLTLAVDGGTKNFRAAGRDGGLSWGVWGVFKSSATAWESFSLSRGNGNGKAVTISHAGTGPGFAFFAKAYGAAIGTDYHHAAFVAAVPFKPFEGAPGGTETYYRGARFGYKTTVTVDGMTSLNLYTLAAFADDLAFEKRCGMKYTLECTGGD